jgi:molybdopterin-biosynthesis enzyme MoeA-like protein
MNLLARLRKGGGVDHPDDLGGQLYLGIRTRPYHTQEVISQRRESEIAALLSDTLDRFPFIKIGSYPQWGEAGYRVKIVVESKERESVACAAEHLRKALE